MAKRHHCAGKLKMGTLHSERTLAVMFQIATLGEAVRRRAKSVTVYVCDNCIRRLNHPDGRAVRRAITLAIKASARELKPLPRSRAPRGT